MRTAAVLLIAWLAGCRSAPEQPREGHLEARWKGPEPGELSTRATAGWCAARRLLEITAIQGDTGIALALYPRESLMAGAYPVVDPIRAESVPPAVGVALRWLGEKNVQGFQGDSGLVRLERSSTGSLSGTMAVRARSVVDTQRLLLQGSFRDLIVQRQPPGCRAGTVGSKDAVARDTGVH